MVPDKFNMVDMDGIDLIMMQGEEVPGLYTRLVESIAQCRYQCLYNWFFDGVVIPPTYVKMEVNEDDEITINEGVTVSPDDVIHIYSIEPPPITPTIIPLSVEENGVYRKSEGVDGFDPVTVSVPGHIPVVLPLSVTENGTYTAPEGVDGYSPITVNVSDEPDPPELIADYYMNSSSSDVLSHEFIDGSYSIVIVQTITNAPISNLSVQLNGVDISSSFATLLNATDLTMRIFRDHVFSSGDVLEVSNSVKPGNSGVQLFIMKNVKSGFFINKVGNNNSTFTIPAMSTSFARAFEVSRYGYYSGNNTIPLAQMIYTDVDIQSIPCPNEQRYWYGGTYAVTLFPF